MNLLQAVGRVFFAVAIVVFGVQQLIYREFVTRVFPRLPAAIPWHSAWALLAGVGLIVAGGAVLLGKSARAWAIGLGVIILLSTAVFYFPQVAAAKDFGAVWTNTGKALALAGGAFLVAASLGRGSRGGAARLLPYGRLLVGAFLAVAGIQHFLFPQFVATLVPHWVPRPLFWTYFTGAALIAGGLGMMIPRTMKLAAALSALMVFLWVVLLHIPRAIAAPRGSNELTAVFEALAVSGAALLVAANGRSR